MTDFASVPPVFRSLVSNWGKHGNAAVLHDYLYWEFHWWKEPLQAIRNGKWKAIKDYGTMEIELFDLENDVEEKHNIAIIVKSNSLDFCIAFFIL